MQEVGSYAYNMIFLKTDDEILYKYTNKLYRRIQWHVLTNQFWPIVSSLGCYYLTRQLKAFSSYDKFYFWVPYIFMNYGVYLSEVRRLYEIGYPAHPYIQIKRTELINKCCYKYPTILKNEIEYLHLKINNLKDEQLSDELL